LEKLRGAQVTLPPGDLFILELAVRPLGQKREASASGSRDEKGKGNLKRSSRRYLYADQGSADDPTIAVESVCNKFYRLASLDQSMPAIAGFPSAIRE